MKRIHIIILTIVLMMGNAIRAAAAPPVVTAELDSATLLMGKIGNINLEVTHDKTTMGFFPLLRNITQQGVIPVCGDSVELRAPVKIDTTEINGRIKVAMQIPVQSFDSGFYLLPEFTFVTPGDTVHSKQLSLRIVPVDVTADTPISDYANVSEPENKSIWDAVPDWIIDYWWILIILAALIVAGIWLYRKYRRDGYIIPPKPQPTPYEIAVESLRDLKEKKLWEQGMEKEYYTDLTEILRRYLYGRFSINAMEMTSRQIMGALKRNKETAPLRGLIRELLEMADFVKFAKVRPLPEDNIKSLDNVWQFVKETKPVEPDPADEATNGNSKAGKGAKGLKGAKGVKSNKTKKVKGGSNV